MFPVSVHEKANLNRAGTHPWPTHIEDNKGYFQTDLMVVYNSQGRENLRQEADTS